jgi:hypothetical protein
MPISTYLRPNIHQNSPEILGVKFSKTSLFLRGTESLLYIARFSVSFLQIFNDLLQSTEISGLTYAIEMVQSYNPTRLLDTCM